MSDNFQDGSQPDIPPSVVESEAGGAAHAGDPVDAETLSLPGSVAESDMEVECQPCDEEPEPGMFLCKCKNECYKKFEFVSVLGLLRQGLRRPPPP
eukprot:1699166-Pyramimonas_sp.AAC.1